MKLIKKKKEINIIEEDFNKISKHFQKKIGFYWWFLNITRLDLALWGLPQKNSFKSSLNNFIKLFLSLIMIFFFKSKKSNFDKSCIFLFEDFIWLAWQRFKRI